MWELKQKNTTQTPIEIHSAKTNKWLFKQNVRIHFLQSKNTVELIILYSRFNSVTNKLRYNLKLVIIVIVMSFFLSTNYKNTMFRVDWWNVIWTWQAFLHLAINPRALWCKGSSWVWCWPFSSKHIYNAIMKSLIKMCWVWC